MLNILLHLATITTVILVLLSSFYHMGLSKGVVGSSTVATPHLSDYYQLELVAHYRDLYPFQRWTRSTRHIGRALNGGND